MNWVEVVRKYMSAYDKWKIRPSIDWNGRTKLWLTRIRKFLSYFMKHMN